MGVDNPQVAPAPEPVEPAPGGMTTGGGGIAHTALFSFISNTEPEESFTMVLEHGFEKSVVGFLFFEHWNGAGGPIEIADKIQSVTFLPGVAEILWKSHNQAPFKSGEGLLVMVIG
jgi:hypothetical protein